MRKLIDTLFPAGDPPKRKRTSELIETGLAALRAARDERSVTTDRTTMAPSRLELRLPQVRYDELAEMGALRDVEFYFNDELMKDLAARRIRTFGDQPVYVTIGTDTTLQPNEIYAIVLAPRTEPADRGWTGGAPEVYDRTSVLGDADAPLPPPAAPSRVVVLWLTSGGRRTRVELAGRQWIIGRRGVSGNALPPGYVKVDLDMPPTVSREQMKVELIGGDRLRVERIGKAAMGAADGEPIAAGESRLVPLGAPIAVDDCTMTIEEEIGERR